ncbi:hypothetical protein [Labrenzia sp. DG1229]|uniref:hypothetical protein n=1 Tax=Labrenzia sp. DG1229 TaxID=681847 RepID=UPI0012EB4659|nr:hypothetical protein [Labrenzia sp. DG1229]
MPKTLLIYLIFILSDFSQTGLDIYVQQFHPQMFATYFDLSIIVFLIWSLFVTIWFFKTDAEAQGKKLSYSMGLGLVLIMPITSAVHFFGTRNWKIGLGFYVLFWAGLIASTYVNFMLFETFVVSAEAVIQ